MEEHWVSYVSTYICPLWGQYYGRSIRQQVERRGGGLQFDQRLIIMKYVHHYLKIFIIIIISILIILFLPPKLWHLSH